MLKDSGFHPSFYFGFESGFPLGITLKLISGISSARDDRIEASFKKEVRFVKPNELFLDVTAAFPIIVSKLNF